MYAAPLPIEIQQSSERTIQGTLNFPMPETFFVRADGPVSSQESALNGAGRFFTSVNAAFAACTANKDQRIVCLPGHTENISTADAWSNIKAGVSVLGWGRGTRRPKITWSAAAATILVDVANVSIQNFILEMAGDVTASSALTVAAPITVSAAGFGLYDCSANVGVDADQLIGTGITTTADADDMEIMRCSFWGATAAEIGETIIQIIGCDRLKMYDNTFIAATDAVAVGVVRFATTASLYIDLRRNTYINKKAASTCAVTGLANVSGSSRDEHFAYLDTTSLTPWLTSTGIMTFHRPTVTNTAGEVGTEAVGTVSA